MKQESSHRRRICLLSNGHPASNPRLVREAEVLARGGYKVTAITPRFMSRWVPHDDLIIKSARWKHISVDLLGSRAARRHWRWIRFRRKLNAVAACFCQTEHLVGTAIGYFNVELAARAAMERADLYVAHQHAALPAAAWAARKAGTLFAFDAEDLLADCSAEPQDLIRAVEQRYLRDCAYISTMSLPAAERLRETNELHTSPFVLHNTPSLIERDQVAPPASRKSSDTLRIYWFGQTIGYHSRADQVVRALPFLIGRARLTLRGHYTEPYLTELKGLAASLGVSGRLEVLPLAPPAEMVRLAAEHDILLGSQPGKELFHQMAIGNKVFTGMMAGLGLALTDTIAHKQLLMDAPGTGFLFADNDPQEFARALNHVLAQPRKLRSMKENSWVQAEQSFNWDKESHTLLRQIERILPSRNLGAVRAKDHA